MTGANRGTGRAIRHRLTADGFTVRCLNRHSCEDHTDRIVADLTDARAASDATRAVLADVPALDLLVLNAVTRGLGRVAELDPAVWDEAWGGDFYPPPRRRPGGGAPPPGGGGGHRAQGGARPGRGGGF
ncbi:SDR family NAD(P)-dependent oxidoreductase [Streptomyces sp. NPDC058330]|uniref:SDR family NAD(P)-dependent oxidoreductase n=1 Tax=Streptomyces sp. NPDC058330 TaxID=3346449 RepID=UPI0036E24B18